MGEGGVTDDGNCGPLAGIGGTLGHGDAGTHIYTRVDSLEGRHKAQGVATDVTKHAGIGILLQHLVEGGVNVAVTATLAQCGGTRSDILTAGITLAHGQTQSILQCVGVQLASTGQFAGEAAFDLGIAGHHATHQVLDEGLAFLGDEDGITLGGHAADELLGHGILADFEHGIGATVGIAFHQIVISDTGGDDTHRVVSTVDVLVVLALDGTLLEVGLLTRNSDVALDGVAGEQYPVAGLGVIVQFVLGTRSFLHLDNGTAVGHAGGHAHEHGEANLLAQLVGLLHHVIGLLLGAGLQRGNHRELAIEAAVLLVLGGVHRGVVGHEDHQTAVHTRHARVNERVGAHVQAHMLHADQGALAHEGHAEGSLHRRLFVGTPAAMNVAFHR